MRSTGGRTCTTSLDWRPALTALVDEAVRSGARLVAPATFAGLPCDPGALPGADGVIADPNIPRAMPARRGHGDREYWFASPSAAADADGMLRQRARGESLATAHVSAWLLRSAK
jgi:hypothetical protein